MSTITHVDSAGDSDSDCSVGFSLLFGDDVLAAQIDLPMALPYATISVQSYVPMKLDLRADNFSKWKACFEALCGTFELLSHIDGTTPPNPLTPVWLQEDCCVRAWLYGTVSDAVHDLIMTPEPTARKHWAIITARFEANKAPRAIFLSQAFMTLTQGDLSVEAYGQEMKRAADRLRDVGKPVDDSTMVLNLLRGANPRFSTTCDIIAGDATMDFAGALDMLALKELRLAEEGKMVKSTALHVSSTSSSSSSGCTGPCRSCTSSPQQFWVQHQQPGKQQRGGGQPKRKKTHFCKGGGGGSQQQQQHRAPNPTGPWICINPWGQQQGQAGGSSGSGGGGQTWRAANSGQQRGGPGLLGSSPQAHTAISDQQSAGPQYFDTAGLMAALQQMSLQGDAWVMDTGASTHMHSSKGIIHSHLPTADSSIIVGNGARIPITTRGSSILDINSAKFVLNNIIVAPSIVRNLLSVR